jgi:hypothetical protein
MKVEQILRQVPAIVDDCIDRYDLLYMPPIVSASLYLVFHVPNILKPWSIFQEA